MRSLPFQAGPLAEALSARTPYTFAQWYFMLRSLGEREVAYVQAHQDRFAALGPDDTKLLLGAGDVVPPWFTV